MSGETFGQMLRRLREARTMLAPLQHGNPASRLVERTLSQNELARRSGLDPALVHRIEAGRQRHQARRQTVLALADGLALDEHDTDRLLIAAGYWPWGEAVDVGQVLRFVRDCTDLAWTRPG